jgi:hypothetical protein
MSLTIASTTMAAGISSSSLDEAEEAGGVGAGRGGARE